MNRFYGKYVGKFELIWLPLFCEILITVEVIMDRELVCFYPYRRVFWTTNKHCE